MINVRGSKKTDSKESRTEPEIRLAKQKSQLHFLMWSFAVIMSTAVVASLFLIISLVSNISEIQGNNRAVFQRIVSCTDPNGECYQQSQRRTGEAIGTINEVTILAAACARIPSNDTEAEIRVCIEEGLK